MTETQAQRFDELLDKFNTGMLVTQTTTGELQARPMAIAKHRDGGVLYFATSREAGKMEEIETHPEVAVTMQDSDQQLSLTGHAEAVHDRALIERFFHSAWRLWFPEGKDDPNLVLIKIEPVHGAYWDMSKSANKARFVFEAGKAVFEDEQIDTDKLAGHGQVNLS